MRAGISQTVTKAQDKRTGGGTVRQVPGREEGMSRAEGLWPALT